MSELEPFRQFLIALLTEARETATRATNNNVRAVLESNVALLERIAMFISKSIKEGEINMEKAKIEIKVLDKGMFEAVGRATKSSPLTEKIVALAEELKPGQYRQIDPEGIQPGHFRTKVYNLKNRIGANVKPKDSLIINGKLVRGLFIVKLTEQQMSAEPKRRRQQQEA